MASRNKNFSVKEIVQKIDKKIDKLNGAIGDHDVAIQKITGDLKYITTELPEKGWCERVNNTLFPALPEQPLAWKVNTLWNLSRLAKIIVLGLFALGIGNILVEIW